MDNSLKPMTGDLWMFSDGDSAKLAFKRIFPQGLPSPSQQLSREQEDFIIEYRASGMIVLSETRDVTVIAGDYYDPIETPRFWQHYKELQEKHAFDSVAHEYDEYYQGYVFEARDKHVVDIAKRASQTASPNTKVFIEFGANHDFSRYGQEVGLSIKRLEQGAQTRSERNLAHLYGPEHFDLHGQEAIRFWSRARFDTRFSLARKQLAIKEQQRILAELISQNSKVDPDIIPYLLTQNLRRQALRIIDSGRILGPDAIMNEEQFLKLFDSKTPLDQSIEPPAQEVKAAAKTWIDSRSSVEALFKGLTSPFVDPNNCQPWRHFRK